MLYCIVITYRLLDDAGDHRVGKVQIFRPLRHFIHLSGEPWGRPAADPLAPVPPLLWAVNSPELGSIPPADEPEQLKKLTNENAPPEKEARRYG